MAQAYRSFIAKAMIVFAVLIAALGSVAPADAGPSLDRKAFTLAKSADARSKRTEARVTAALKSLPIAVKGEPGARGLDGASGGPGTIGTNGRDGLNGTQGAQGSEGARGVDGHDGANGQVGSLTVGVASAVNQDAVDIVGSGGTSTVVSIPLRRDDAGRVLVTADGQLNGENDTNDYAICALRMDGSVIADRVVTVPSRSQVIIAASAFVDVSVGQHAVSFTCRKGSDLSVLSFPSERTRLSVIG